MHKGRLEAFSDGVLAIIITIMVLELKPPEGAALASLRSEVPVLLSYLFSFLMVAIYWNNHHHMLQAAERVNGRILWANSHLLFWLSLIPFGTAWIGRQGLAPVPTALFGLTLLCAAVAYYILAHAIATHHGEGSTVAKALGDDLKGKASIAIYAASVAAALWLPALSYLGYVAVALIWLTPDRRFEKK